MGTEEQFSRTALLIGEDGVRCLARARVAIFGIGGVGGYAAEALARCGVGAFVLVDHDVISESNINRQIIALHSTVGQYKVDVMRARIRDINPSAEVETHRVFYLPETAAQFDFSAYDYVVDAVDTVTAKLEIITSAKACGVPVISSMGAGNKLDPGRLAVADIYDTSVCPLARVMRRELKKRGVSKLTVVYSAEEAKKPLPENAPETDAAQESRRRQTPGSVAFVPSVAGLMLAGEVVKNLLQADEENIEKTGDEK